MISAIVYSLLAFSIQLQSGGRASLHGTGPPVIFSSGLFNTIPSWLYRHLFQAMTPNVTLVVPTGPISTNTLDEIADALRVQHVGLFAHSSFIASALTSPRLHATVLCDPITLPDIGVTGLQPISIQPQCPVLTLRASRAYEDATVPTPVLNTPAIIGKNCIDETIDDVGHPDILDDVWADLAARTGLWDTVRTYPTMSFREWQTPEPTIDTAEIRESRSLYRRRVAERAVGFLLNPHEQKRQ